MKRGFLICLLVFGLTHAVEDNVGSETKEASKATGGNINFRFFDKNKRGATKITNADNPSFNHLSTTNAISNSASSSNTGFKPSTANSNPLPFRYLYNQQYYQPNVNPYLTYVQFPHAAQIAAQYSFQPNPVAHYLQTPTQVQYVSTPTVAQVPQIKYQTFSNDFSTANAGTSDSSSSSATNSQFVPQSQTSASPQTYVASASSGSSSAATTSQAKQIQLPLYAGQTVQPVYYAQQPLLTYFQQPQATNFLYQQPNTNYLLRQQQQIANVYGANRFGLYTPPQNAQLTYLVPMVVSQLEQDSTTTTSNLKSSDKSLSNTQSSPSSSSFTYGTKA